jgi:hypothetical protein
MFGLANFVEAAIDDQRLTSDETSFLAGQECDRTHDVLRLGQPLDRLLLPDELLRFVGNVGRCRSPRQRRKDRIGRE